jgi:hypothetical protein
MSDWIIFVTMDRCQKSSYTVEDDGDENQRMGDVCACVGLCVKSPPFCLSINYHEDVYMSDLIIFNITDRCVALSQCVGVRDRERQQRRREKTKEKRKKREERQGELSVDVCACLCTC